MAKNLVIERGLKLLMNPSGKEIISPTTKESEYCNLKLSELIKEGIIKGERVGIYCSQITGKWYFSNVDRKEGYYLNATNATNHLSTRINERQYIEALNLLASEINNVCINIIIAKEPRKVNYKIAYLQIVGRDKVWVF